MFTKRKLKTYIFTPTPTPTNLRTVIIMNNQTIENIIKSNNLPCPDFKFENPLLDKNVARALSKSFIKILNILQRDSNFNNNLRLSILEKIRKMCQTQAENHLETEYAPTLLTEVYEQKIKEDSRLDCFDSTDKELDAFLIRQMQDMDINSSCSPSLSPETLQALINVNENGVCLNTLCADIIHWNSTDSKNTHILKELWMSENSMIEDISVKLKSELEKSLLETCHNILNKTVTDIEELFAYNTNLLNIVKKSSISANCFQICCGVLNYLFIMTNFDIRIQTFVQIFVKHVKESCSHLSMSVLYPPHVSHIVVLLDIDLEQLPIPQLDNYIETTLKHLTNLHSESENDLIMLLSHYSKWFDIYFNISQ